MKAIFLAAAVFSLWIEGHAIGGGPAEQICDVNADYSLCIEDYAAAIGLHREILRENPQNALAHYHLGFAEGMIGLKTSKLDEYRRAEALGLWNWDLFLNLGLARFEAGDLEAATENLRKAVQFGGEHPESHFILALVEERRGMLTRGCARDSKVVAGAS